MIRPWGAVLALCVCVAGCGMASVALATDAGRLMLAPFFQNDSETRADTALSRPPPPPDPYGDPDANIAGTDFISALPPVESHRLVDDKTESSAPPTPIERLYAARQGEGEGPMAAPLRHFGHDLWPALLHGRAQHRPTAPAVAVAPIKDDYVLGPGDTIRLTISGDTPKTDLIRIAADGVLVIEGMEPIGVMGRSVREVRSIIHAQDTQQLNQQVTISVASVRPVAITVMGAVHAPGQHTLTAMHTIFHALEAAGGIAPMGSLRSIQLVGSDGSSERVDLYDWLIEGRLPRHRSLRDGDRILVPPIGASVAIAGSVKRPAIYELPQGAARSLTVSGALRMAGGALPGKGGHLQRHRQNEHGADTVTTLTFGQIAHLIDGDMLILSQPSAARARSVELTGYVRTPGFFALEERPTLRRLLDPARVIREGYYPLFAMIERRDPHTMTRRLIPFVPLTILSGQEDTPLMSGDRVHLFADATIRALMTQDSAPHASFHAAPQQENSLLYPVSESDLGRPRDDGIPGALTGTAYHDLSPLMIETIRQHTVSVQGSIALPGLYPVGGNVRVDDLLATSGHLARDADPAFVEITRYDPKHNTRERHRGPLAEHMALTVRAGDQVRVPRHADQTKAEAVVLLGEVAKPGRYDVMAGETLSALLERAGGLTPYAYPIGAVFSRASERERERALYRSKAQDLELRLASRLSGAEKDRDRPSEAEIDAAETLIHQLRQAEPLGRITVQADPSLLAANPAEDILLEGGDRIYIPRRPLTVRVAGEVHSPAALQFISGQSPRAYIEQAGGPSYYADTDRAFVVYPDGSADPLAVSIWNTRRDLIPPGSTIIVPRDPEPFRFIDSARDITQILSNLATAALFADEIGDD